MEKQQRIKGFKAQMQAQEDGLGRRHWKEVQKDFKGTEKQFAGTVCRRACRTSSKVCGMGNVLG